MRSPPCFTVWYWFCNGWNSTIYSEVGTGSSEGSLSCVNIVIQNDAVTFQGLTSPLQKCTSAMQTRFYFNSFHFNLGSPKCFLFYYYYVNWLKNNKNHTIMFAVENLSKFVGIKLRTDSTTEIAKQELREDKLQLLKFK